MKILIKAKGDRLERQQIYDMLGYSRDYIYLIEGCNAHACYKELVGFNHGFVEDWGLVATITLSLKKCNNLGEM